MNTKDLPAIIMLLAGGVYSLIGIKNQTPLTDFLTQLLIILLIFWIFGGIVRMVLDKFMKEFADKPETDEDKKDEKSDEDNQTKQD